MTKIAGSGSGFISQRHGSADPDPDPDHTLKCHGSATLEPLFLVVKRTYSRHKSINQPQKRYANFILEFK
jgi:hypothetical protein